MLYSQFLFTDKTWFRKYYCSIIKEDFEIVPWEAVQQLNTNIFLSESVYPLYRLLSKTLIKMLRFLNAVFIAF